MLPKVEKAAFPFNLAIMSLCIKCLLHSASDAKWRLHSFFSFSVITLPLISFLCFLSLSILLRFVSLSFAHSVNLYFWLECGSDSRDNIFLFAVSSVLNLSFGWWNFHTTHTHTYSNTVCWTAIFIQSTIWNAYFVACKWTLKWWWCCCHRLSPRGSPFTQSDKECDRLNACNLSARSRVSVCMCVKVHVYVCDARARSSTFIPHKIC